MIVKKEVNKKKRGSGEAYNGLMQVEEETDKRRLRKGKQEKKKKRERKD